MNDQYDVICLGAGPAGASAAGVTAAAGLRTLLVEREAFPRFHVGESLMPETYWPLQRLGLVDRVREMGFQVKNSVQFVTNTGKESEPFFFREHDDRDSSQTWQVERSDFDKLLFDRAAELGADCRDRTRLLDVHFEGERAVGVSVRGPDGEKRDIACQVVIDGTGQQSVIANKLGLKEINPRLKKAAIWGYYRDAERDPGENAGATIILQTESKDCWFWFIPQARGITSIGCVGDHEHLLKGRGTPEEVFAEELASCPGLLPRLKMAERVGGLKVAKEFSYTTKQHAGPGWVLVGDAFGFIDPVYSSGVYFALETGVRAGDAVVEGIRKQDISSEQLGNWTGEFKAGMSRVRELVHAFYSKDFSFGRFMQKFPQHRGNLTDLLIGRVFDDKTGMIFDDMIPAIEQAAEERRIREAASA
ncbi:NAD(P)/FAD-dependent oxidoreductase [Planctomycetaceae bacterium SH139]